MARVPAPVTVLQEFIGAIERCNVLGPEIGRDSSEWVQKLLSSLSDEEITAVNRALIESAFRICFAHTRGLSFKLITLSG